MAKKKVLKKTEKKKEKTIKAKKNIVLAKKNKADPKKKKVVVAAKKPSKIVKKEIKEPVKKVTKAPIQKKPVIISKKKNLKSGNGKKDIKKKTKLVDDNLEVEEQVPAVEQYHHSAQDFRPHYEQRQMTWDPFATPIDVPGAYLKDRIILLTIDPKFIYTYWEVKPETLEAGRNFIGQDSHLVLRIYDVTAVSSFNGYNAHHCWDIGVNDRMGSWYIRLEQPDKTLVIDIGLKNNRGDFYTLVRSNFSTVPRDYVVKSDKIYWMTVNEEGEVVITEVEELTDEDLELLRRMLGDKLYKRLLEGTLTEYLGSSKMRQLFIEVEIVGAPGASDLAAKSEKIQILESSKLIDLSENKES